MTPKSERIFFDISALLDYVDRTTRLSGIQRVIAMIVNEVARKYTETDLYFSYFDRKKKKYVCLPFSDLDPALLLKPMSLKQAMDVRSFSASDHRLVRKYRNKPTKLFFHVLKNDLQARRSNHKHFENKGTTLEEWIEVRKGPSPKSKQLRERAREVKTIIRPRDCLVLMDSSWQDELWSEFSGLRTSGLKVISFIHDLIPITAPNLVPAGSPRTFYHWLSNTCAYTDLYICNSRATKLDLDVFLEGKESATQVASMVVPLAQQFGVPGNASVGGQRDVPTIDQHKYPLLLDLDGIHDDIRRISSTPFVLCVGTIEARKNHWRLIQAWRRMAMAGVEQLPRLVLAGRVGAMSKDVVDLLAATGGLAGLVEIVDGPSDEELAFLYKFCEFTVMPSLYEGWGLPVGEALSYGKTAVVANNSSLPEVGGDLVEYCDATSVKSIEDACTLLISHPERRKELEKRIGNTRLRNWEDVSKDLMNCVLDYSSAPTDTV